MVDVTTQESAMASDLASLISRIEALERNQIEDRRRLQRLEDIEALQQLKYRYFRALDSADMDLLASLLTEDFHCRFQSDRFDMICNDRAEYLASMATFFDANKATQHQGHHPEITIGEDGNSAAGIWYLQDFVHNVETGWFLMGTNFYRDSYVRTAEGWKHRSSFWTRHVEISEQLPFKPNYTGRYLKTYGTAPAS